MAQAQTGENTPCFVIFLEAIAASTVVEGLTDKSSASDKGVQRLILGLHVTPYRNTLGPRLAAACSH